MARMAAVDGGRVFHGCETVAGPGDPFACWFRVLVDDAWLTKDVEVRVVDAPGERSLRLTVDADRRWFVDGVPEPQLSGCLDVDVAATPLTNTFPIRRLRDLAVGDAVTLAVAWVDVPALDVTRVEQSYRRLAPAAGDDVWEYSDPAHGAFVLTVDGDGLVLDYEGFATRV